MILLKWLVEVGNWNVVSSVTCKAMNKKHLRVILEADN